MFVKSAPRADFPFGVDCMLNFAVRLQRQKRNMRHVHWTFNDDWWWKNRMSQTPPLVLFKHFNASLKL